MDVVDLSGHEGVLSTAIQVGLTFHDASYLLAAKSLKAALITDGEDVVEASKRVEVETLRSRGLPVERASCANTPPINEAYARLAKASMNATTSCCRDASGS